jgi:hypothetical protein
LKEPLNILSENETKEIIEIVSEIFESKETISNQLKGFVSQHKFYEELILAQNQEIMLLKKALHKQSQKFNHRFDKIDSKLDLILSTLKISNDSMTQKIATLQEDIHEQKRQITNEVKTSTESLKIKMIDLKFNLISYKLSHEGILQNLKKSEPNSISLSCLSI